MIYISRAVYDFDSEDDNTPMSSDEKRKTKNRECIEKDIRHTEELAAKGIEVIIVNCLKNT